jgi:hypothetical protein
VSILLKQIELDKKFREAKYQYLHFKSAEKMNLLVSALLSKGVKL